MARSVLFVCTGNTFRSMTAEHALKKHLADNGIEGWSVGSAGIEARPHMIDIQTIKDIISREGACDFSHEQRKLTREMLDSSDAVVVMATRHDDFLREEFNYHDAVLFNEIAIHEKSDVLDVADYGGPREEVVNHIDGTVQYLFEKTPMAFEKLRERYFLFEDFISGARSHRNGYPFIPLHENEHAIAFMSIDIPQKEDGHILVIPKKRYVHFSEIPEQAVNDMMHVIQRIGKALQQNHGGYNLLLNNGKDAGQYIFHSHVHIVPRNPGDGIAIEVWDKQTVSKEEFERLNHELKSHIDSHT